jgi:hypothetical protein
MRAMDACGHTATQAESGENSVDDRQQGSRIPRAENDDYNVAG